mmetsp:Transcript_25998/g.55890  ORF Transcript_25998/g.55890 Transcript_25998/m.55890 type:complete len:478 (+) Transcript_25998:552-1985(+)
MIRRREGQGWEGRGEGMMIRAHYHQRITGLFLIGNHPRAVILHRSRRQHYNAVVVDNRPAMELEQLPLNVRSLWAVGKSENCESKSGDDSKLEFDNANLMNGKEKIECISEERQNQSTSNRGDVDKICKPSNVLEGEESALTTIHSTNSPSPLTSSQTFGKFYCGCAGFSSSSWVGNFYPKSIVGHNSERQLDHYQQHFRTVEINSTFYGIPSESTVNKWKNTFAKPFKVVVKAPRGLTHEQPQLDCSVLSTFLSRMQILNETLSCILIQCPRTLSVTVSQLEQIKRMLEREASWYKGRLAFEFRNKATYFDQEVRECLKLNSFALVLHPNSLGRSTVGTSVSGRGNSDPLEYQPEQLSELVATGNLLSGFVYLRLHGFNDEHRGEYSVNQLREIAQQIHYWREQGLEVYCYFLNDLGPTQCSSPKKSAPQQHWDKWCAMPKNAKQLEALVYRQSKEDIPDAPKKLKSTLLNFFGKK